jgi:predicted acyl esterase
MVTRVVRSDFELIMRPGVHPERVVGKKAPPPPVHSQARENGLLIERNIRVALRDGVHIYIDVYRPLGPTGEQALPALLGWSPYGKHNVSDRLAWPAAGVEPGWMSAYTAFEAPDPAYWCPRGYAIVYPDPRGAWYSEGDLRHGGMGEAEDCFDLITWIGSQAWSNGKVGMTGVSYLTAIQYQVAPLHPPHLAAINPFEGFSDWYREFAYHGGIPETSFLVRGTGNLQWSTTRTEDTLANALAHPLYDAYWASKECDLEAIEVPAYVVASWSDHGLHTRGTLEAYKRMRSKQKWLEVHGRKKWQYYYEPANVEKQRAFFDHFLRAPGTVVPAWPKVLIEVRERANVGEKRAENEWPLARTQYRKLYLDASQAALCDEPVTAVSEARYDPTSPEGVAAFDYRFAADTEITGHMSLHLVVEAVGADDMDLFVAIQKLDRNGELVGFVWYAMLETGPAALGWLRVSHRELDPARSTPQQPVHSHLREQLLKPGERVAVDIEIWPSSTLFRAGETLRVVIQGVDIYREGLPNAPFARHENTRNRGTHVIHTGGAQSASSQSSDAERNSGKRSLDGGALASHLLIPVIPPIR